MENKEKFRLLFIIIYVLCMLLLGTLFILLFMVILAPINNVDTANVMKLILSSKAEITEEEYNVAYMAQGFGNATMYLVLFVSAILLLKNDFKEDFIGLKDNRKFYIIYIIIAMVIFTGIAFLLSYLVGLKVTDSQNQTSIVRMMKTGAMIPMIISTVIFAPVVEEMVYRKCIFHYCRNFKIYVRYILSIILFVFPHVITSIGKFSTGDYFLMLIPYVADAFMLALTYHKGKFNIYTSIICHIANNLLAVILVFI